MPASAAPAASPCWLGWAALALLAEGRSQAQVARELGVHPASLTRELQALESQVGLQLLERGTKGSRLSAAGQRALPHAQALLAEARSQLRRCWTDAGPRPLAWRLWAPGRWVRGCLLPHLAPLMRRHPERWLDLRTEPAQRHAQELDVRLDIGPLQTGAPVLWQRRVRLVPVGPAAGAERLARSRAALEALPQVHLGTETPGALRQRGRILPVQARAGAWMQTDDPDFALALAAEGSVAWLPEHLLLPLPPRVARLPGGWSLGPAQTLACQVLRPDAAVLGRWLLRRWQGGPR